MLGRRFRVGLIALGSGGLFLGLLLFILGSGLSSDRVYYHILFDENVKGMVVGSKVDFQGVPFGVVSDIRFAGGQTRVEVAVDPSKAVVQDVTRARLDRLLVTGQVTVELEGYEPKARPLTPGSRIEAKADPMHSLTKSLPEAFNEIGTLINGLQQTVARLNGFLDPGNQARVAAILDHLEHGSATLPEQLGRTLTGMDGLLVELRATVQKLDRVAGGLTDNSGAEAGSLVAQARAGLEGLQHVTEEFGALAREANSMLGGVRTPTVAMLSSLRATLDEVRGLARLLRMAPNSLLYGLDRRAEDAAMPPPGGGK